MPRIKAGSIAAHKALTRSQILAATRELLADTGSADLNLAELAAEAGVGRTTIYEYFRDRDDLIATLVEETLPQVVINLIEGVRGDQTADQRLLDLAEAVVEFVATDPVLGTILHREGPRLSAEAQDRIRLAHSDLSVAMARTFQDAVDRGHFRPLAADLAGRLIQDTIMSAARAVIAAPNRLPEVRRTLRAFLEGGLAQPVISSPQVRR
ncbi:MAG TPA: TetR/AcrR family transcriptional regulator [Acidimicrobiia bacterium]